MKHHRWRMGTVGKAQSRRGRSPGAAVPTQPGWAGYQAVSRPPPTKEVTTMIIDSLTITGILTFVAISAFLILSLRNDAKQGDLNTDAPYCDQFCN